MVRDDSAVPASLLGAAPWDGVGASSHKAAIQVKVPILLRVEITFNSRAFVRWLLIGIFVCSDDLACGSPIYDRLFQGQNVSQRWEGRR